jgi:Na+/proline symporter
MRLVLAIIAGLTNELLHINVASFGDFASLLAIGVGIAFYLFSIILVQHVFHYGEAELRGKNRHITLGGGTFIFVWIMVTVLFYTIRL